MPVERIRVHIAHHTAELHFLTRYNIVISGPSIYTSAL